MKIKNKLILGAVLIFTTAGIAQAQPTALQLAKKGDDYVGMQSKNKILRIYSDKSTTGLEPGAWHVVYYDPDSFMKSADVQFDNGQQTGVTHMTRPFQMPAKERDVLDMSKITVDSDQALSTAQSQPSLAGLTLKSSRLSLEYGDKGPAWTVEFWAAKKSDPSKTAGIGKVLISATDGRVIESDLRPDKAN